MILALTLHIILIPQQFFTKLKKNHDDCLCLRVDTVDALKVKNSFRLTARWGILISYKCELARINELYKSNLLGPRRVKQQTTAPQMILFPRTLFLVVYKIVYFRTYSTYGTNTKLSMARESNDEIATKNKSDRKINTWYSPPREISILIKPFLTSAWGKKHCNTFKAFQPNNRNYKIANYKDMLRTQYLY